MDFTALNKQLTLFREKGVPGLELIICRDHHILYHECMGFSDAEQKQPASSSDRYWLYSCTKPVTAAAAMCAVEQGLFRLDDAVSQYLPAYADAYLLENGVRRPPCRTMTIRHLLTMSAGLDYNIERLSLVRLQQRENGHATTLQIAQTLAEDPLSFDPGERFQYSLCLDVLGAVIEQASGMTLQQYIKTNILDPLDMSETDFACGTEPPYLVAQYVFDKAKQQVVPDSPRNPLVVSPAFHSGGAGMYATARDYLKFADAMACGGVGTNGNRILQASSIDMMRREQLYEFQVLSTFGCTCGPDYGYGLGVRTRIAFDHGVKSSLGEFGWDGAAGADVLIDPEHRLSMVYMQHVRNWPAFLGPVHLQLRDALYPVLGLA